MIVRPHQHWFLRLFDWHGSVLSNIVFRLSLNLLMTPLVSMFISYTFLSLEALAEELEHPFGTAPNHLPLDALCVTIERNLKAMNGDMPLPEPLQPDAHFNLT